MTRFFTVICIISLLSGCAIVPLDYGYRDRGYGHWGNHHHHRGDYSRDWRQGDYRY
jgi:hypothetical protein